jgi:hypothetical protein
MMNNNMNDDSIRLKQSKQAMIAEALRLANAVPDTAVKKVRGKRELVPCRSCGRQLSTRAVMCPGCGDIPEHSSLTS